MCISRQVNKNLITISHVSDDITPQMKLSTTVYYLLISRQSFKLLKEIERVYIFLIDQTPNWDTSHKHTNNINLKKTYLGQFQYFNI